MVQFLKQLKAIQKQRLVRIAFVCTANCCRSPIAEILCEKMLIKELGSKEAINKKQLAIESAATGYSGLSIATGSAEILIEEEGVGISRCNVHKGRLLSAIEPPDLILTMTGSHLDEIDRFMPNLRPMAFTLEHFVKADKELAAYDIKDPLGGTKQDFKKIKDQIKENLVLLIEELKQSGLI